MTVFQTLEEIWLPQQSTCVALGLFDGLHLGHRSVINRAVEQAETAGLVPCAFTFGLDGSRPRYKQPQRLLSESTRQDLLDRWGIRYAFSPPFHTFRDMEPEAFVRRVLAEKFRAKAVCCGENFRFGKGGRASAEELRELGAWEGIQVLVAPLLQVAGQAVSASRIRDLIGQGDIPGANALLGRRFCIDFEVVYGRRLGRKLGSPTINQPFPEDFAIPRFGVYATITRLGDRRHVSVTNVGIKPTVGSDATLAETYIHDFDGDLYGKQVQVEFLQFIRPERRFDSVEELRENIHRDSAAAAGIFARYSR